MGMEQADAARERSHQTQAQAPQQPTVRGNVASAPPLPAQEPLAIQNFDLAIFAVEDNDLTQPVADPLAIQNFDLAIFAVEDNDLTQPVEDNDLTQPVADSPRYRVQRVKRMLQDMDFYQRDVHATYLRIVDGEKQRLVDGFRRTKQDGQQHHEDRVRGLSRKEADGIIAAMMAAPEPDTDYNMDTEDMEIFKTVFEKDDGTYTQKNTIRRLRHLVEQAAYSIDSFDADLAKIRKKWEGILEKEQRAMDALA